MQKLYSRASNVDCAYLVGDESVFVKLDDGPTHELKADRIIVGSLEHFLHPVAPRNEKRLFDLYVPQGARVKAIPFSTVDGMMRQFRFGFNSNIFLARLIEITNNYYVKRSRAIPKELWQYQIRAQHFARLVKDVSALALERNDSELLEFIKRKHDSEFYIDGIILGRESCPTAISVPSVPRSEYVQRFRKNTSICREGNVAESMYILLQGKVAVVKRGRKVSEISTPGEAFGEVALFLEGKRIASLFAEEDTDVYEVKRDNLRKFFSTHRDLFQVVAETLSLRVHDNIEKIMRFEQKVKSLTFQERNSRKSGDGILEKRSRIELTAFCEEVVDIQRRTCDPILEQLLAVYSVIPGKKR